MSSTQISKQRLFTISGMSNTLKYKTAATSRMQVMSSVKWRNWSKQFWQIIISHSMVSTSHWTLTVVAILRINSFLSFFLHRIRVGVVGECFALADHAFTERHQSIKVVRSVWIDVRLQTKQRNVVQNHLIISNHSLDWIEQCFMSLPTQYKLYGKPFSTNTSDNGITPLVDTISTEFLAHLLRGEVCAL